MASRNYNETMANIRRELMGDLGDTEFKYNSVCEVQKGSWKGYMVEILSQDRAYWVKFYMDEPLESLLIQVYPNITVGDAYKLMFNQHVAREMDHRKVGKVRIDGGNCVCVQIERSFEDVPVSVKSIRNALKTVMKLTFNLEDDLDLVAHGSLPSGGDGEHEDPLRHLRSRLGDLPDLSRLLDHSDDDAEDDEDEDEDEDGSGEDMLDRLLRELRGASGEDEDDEDDAEDESDEDDAESEDESDDDESDAEGFGAESLFEQLMRRLAGAEDEPVADAEATDLPDYGILEATADEPDEDDASDEDDEDSDDEEPDAEAVRRGIEDLLAEIRKAIEEAEAEGDDAEDEDPEDEDA